MAEEKGTEVGQKIPAEQKRAIAKVMKQLPDARTHQPRDDGQYYGPVVFTDKHFLAQQVGEKTVVLHPLNRMGELPDLSKGTVVDVVYTGKDSTLSPSDPERWSERVARTPASEQHTTLAREQLGPNVGVYNAPSLEAGLSPRYEGVVVHSDGNALIQRINSRTAIVHDIRDSNAAVKELGTGEAARLTYNNGQLVGGERMERARSQEAQRQVAERAPANRDPADADRAKSFNIARNIVRHNYGKETKIFSAERVNAKDGAYVGTIVAVTDHHVMQRVGKSNFISHNRSDLEGEIGVGKFVNATYDKGRAQVVQAERRADRQRDPQQQRQAPNPTRQRAGRAQEQGVGR